MPKLFERSKGCLKFFLFRILSSIGLWRQWIKPCNGPQVLMYHRVTRDEKVPGITPETFEKHLQLLNKYYQVVDIDTALTTAKLETKAKIVLTFDDGYYDFYTQAWPLLKKYNFPASIYITTDFIDGDMWMWPDKVREILSKSSLDSITLANIGELALSAERYEDNWHRISDYCLPMLESERSGYIDDLAQLFGVELPKKPPQRFSGLTWTQLLEMQEAGLNIGSHTLSHPILTRISQEHLEQELAQSKQVIEEKLATTVKGICYPNGMQADVSENVINTAKKCQYHYGLIAYSQEKSDSVFEISRIAASGDIAALAFSLLDRKIKNNIREYSEQ